MIKSFAFLFSFVFLSACSTNEEHKQIVLRKIAHQVLVQSGYPSSRVLPIVKIKENRYHLKFENEFSFVTDTLINTVNSVLASSDLNDPYMVNVFQCKTKEVIYAYEVSSQTDFILPCLGVSNPKDCYIIQIDFLPNSKSNWAYLVLLFPILLLTWFWVQKKKSIDSHSQTDGPAIGGFIFDASRSILVDGHTVVKLTYQEVKLLEMLVENANQLVSREKLLNEIWEKEGTVVTARSLDVLVSKLRKKIASDPSLTISNVHSKGYKLELS